MVEARAIEVERRFGVVVVDREIQSTVKIEICDGDAASVGDAVVAAGARRVDKLTVANVLEETVTLVAVPRTFADEVVTEEEALFVIIDVCDRTTGER